MKNVDMPALVRTTSYPDGHEEVAFADAGELAEVVARTRTLRELTRGTINSYRLDTSVLRLETLVSLLAVIGDDPEDTDGWPDEVAEDWVDGDEELEDNLHGLDLVSRWIEVNEQRVTAIRVDGGALTPVLVDQDLMRLEAASPLAEHRWSAGGGGRPLDTDGGNSIGILREGVLYEHQWGDLGDEHAVKIVGTTPGEVGAAMADWISRTEIEQAVALTLEPIDLHSTLPDEERAALRDALNNCGIAFSIYDDAVKHSMCEHLASTSERYRRTRSALAQPKSADGEALLALVHAVADEEDEMSALTFATWMDGI